ncbi:MAG: tetratricopeptide repeat protein [Coriobacteriia bacterium]|nr:tetratricopeptide repeat protein [Coriobacteriia bacterium]
MTDRITRWLAYGIFVLLLAILTLVFYVVWTGVLGPLPPRTYVERDLQRLETMVEEKPQVEQVWRDYLRALIVAGQYSKAHRVVEEGRSVLASATAIVDVEEARLLNSEGNPDEAMAILDAAIESQANLLDEQIAELAARSIRASRASLPGGDTLVDAHILRAQILSTLGRWDEATEAYTEALDLDPVMADVLVARGYAYVESGQADKARKDFERALEFIPGLETAAAGLKEIEQ